ncbi:hypothetical protein KP509_09G022700 [Ceratopteris richardii]|uniref:Uncharacterized protein n=1 Tax=Ceratopteris richardii TaxID=49495 RepID=A0A8T2U0Z3_CERRI|nr:hypothetical protein KP509_09G022700 [Ceratopteris richardii]
MMVYLMKMLSVLLATVVVFLICWLFSGVAVQRLTRFQECYWVFFMGRKLLMILIILTALILYSWFCCLLCWFVYFRGCYTEGNMVMGVPFVPNMDQYLSRFLNVLSVLCLFLFSLLCWLLPGFTFQRPSWLKVLLMAIILIRVFLVLRALVLRCWYDCLVCGLLLSGFAPEECSVDPSVDLYLLWILTVIIASVIHCGPCFLYLSGFAGQRLIWLKATLMVIKLLRTQKTAGAFWLFGCLLCRYLLLPWLTGLWACGLKVLILVILLFRILSCLNVLVLLCLFYFWLYCVPLLGIAIQNIAWKNACSLDFFRNLKITWKKECSL